jgi:cytochrome b6-f complex iron-sulfur subunit
MNPLVIVVPVVVVLAGLVVFAALRRRDTSDAIGQLSRETRRRDAGEPVVLEESELVGVSGRQVEAQAALERRPPEMVKAGGSDLAEYVPPDPEALGVTRRQFFNRSIVLLMGLSLTGFGAAVLAFLWPQPKGGFGSKIRVGTIPDVQAAIETGDGFLYLAEGRMWITAYPASALEKAKAVYPASMQQGLEAGVIAIYQ